MSKMVLIAEDEKPMASALKLKLEKAGIDSVIARDGLEAMEFIKKDKYDLVLLDLIMPKKDGFGVLEEVRELNVYTPIMVLTNLGQEEDFNRAKQLGAIDYVIKSNTSISEVVNKVKKALGI